MVKLGCDKMCWRECGEETRKREKRKRNKVDKEEREARREKSTRPKISQNDVDLTELESAKV